MQNFAYKKFFTALLSCDNLLRRSCPNTETQGKRPSPLTPITVKNTLRLGTSVFLESVLRSCWCSALSARNENSLKERKSSKAKHVLHRDRGQRRRSLALGFGGRTVPPHATKNLGLVSFCVFPAVKWSDLMEKMTVNESVFQFVLREVKSMFLPVLRSDFHCGNGSYHEATAPSIFEFVKNLEKSQMIMLIIGSALTLICGVVGIFECCYVYQKISSERRRNKLYFLITLFPISMIFCLVGMFSPRTAPLATSGGMLYFLLCLFVLVSLIRHLTQGRSQLSRELLIAEKRINFQSPPFCCLIPCLPEARPTL
uniref:G_PROTEIN_RECEP_F3_4 domain-containing protein n=2 Tax=Bursaphelenchus xylophilus TaxID=6326 RepID=A0A1I7S9B9_BURXY